MKCVCKSIYSVSHDKVARFPFAFAFGCCINFCIYAMLQTRATFSWPTLRVNLYTGSATIKWPAFRLHLHLAAVLISVFTDWATFL
jgi:hypothetical protein